MILRVTRGPNGPDIAHLGISPHFGQNPFSGYSDIVIFMFCATFSKDRGQPSCSAKLQKKIKRLNAKIIVIQSWYNSIERFFPVLYFAIFSKGCHLDRPIII